MKQSITRLFFLLLAAQGLAQPLFQKVLTGPHVNTPSDSRCVNFVDVNNDGWEDLFISNGPESGAANFLYLNDGSGQFVAVSGTALVSHSQPFDGATFGDFDNDGDLDAFVVTWYGVRNFLYSGNGDGSFNFLGNSAPTLTGTFSETASWGDFDLDGDLDLYVTNSDGDRRNMLYRNNGPDDSNPYSFTLVEDAGTAVSNANTSRSVNWVDYDNDDWPDLYVSNESNQRDDLYHNLGNGTFEKITISAPGQTSHSSMSSSWGDVDNDGDLDVFVANSGYFATQNNQLFINENGSFTALASGDLVTDGGCSFGSGFGDYDNDGDLDLVVSNGFCGNGTLNFLYQNDGNGHFTRDLASIEDLTTPCSYGAAWGDVNNDGFLDLGIATCKNGNSSPLSNNLFYLNTGNGNNWLKIKLEGTATNRSAIGAKLWLTATINGQTVTQMREVSAQSGHNGQSSLTVHFGLGNATLANALRVKFPGGQDTTYTDIFANQLVEIVENQTPTNVLAPAEPPLFQVAVFPNPASAAYTLSLKNLGHPTTLRIVLHDQLGRTLFEKHYDNAGDSLSLQCTKAELGMQPDTFYYLTVEADGKRKVVALK